MNSKKQKRVKRRELPCKVAIEVSHSELSIVIVDRNVESPWRVRGYRTKWLGNAASLNQPEGVDELTTALAEIVEREQLAGGTVQIALSSDFCVTRVIAGETDRMLSELRHLRDRSAHYLSLGAGAKAVSQTVRALDLKHSQGWLTVTNRTTLDNLCTAVENAGLYPEFIEHSMVAVCRAVGRMGLDKDAPVIIIEPNDRGVDLGISYRGQLLFDYRPGGVGSKEKIVQIVERHLERIQRYCSRFFRVAGGGLNHVLLVGTPQDVEQVLKQFENSTRLTASVVHPEAICADWNFEDALLGNPDCVAPLGAVLVESDQVRLNPNDRGFPDLMDAYRHGVSQPLWPLIKRHLWPVAASLLLAVIVYGGALVQHSRAGTIEERIATVEAEAGHASSMRLEAESIDARTKYLQKLDSELVMLPVHAVVLQLVQVKPPGVYLDAVRVGQDGLIIVDGKAELREAVFQFEAGLKSVPLLKSPWVESTRPERLPTTDDATGFTLKAKFADSIGQVE